MPRRCLLIIALWLLPVAVWGQGTTPRAAVPAADDVAEASKLIADVYKQSYAAAKTPTQKQALAQKLLDDAGQTSDDQVSRYAMLQAARKIALGIGDVSLAMQAIDAMARSYAVDEIALRSEAILSLRTLAKTPADYVVITRHLGLLVASLVAKEQYNPAAELSTQAAAAARKSGDTDLGKQWVRRQADLAARAKALAGAQEAEAKLAAAPADPEANSLVGRYYCFVKEDWAKGLPMLALGNDSKLQALAAKDIASAAKPEEELALADAWFALAETESQPAKAALLRYAAKRYEHASVSLSPITRRRIELRLAEVQAATSPFPMNEWVEILDLVELPKHNIRDVWTREGLLVVSRKEQNNAAFSLPVAVRGSYELRIRATVRGGPEFVTVGLGPGLNGALLMINGHEGILSGISHIDGQDATKNPSRGPTAPIAGGRSHLLHMQVDLADEETVAVLATMEGKPLVRWRGATQSLSISKDWPTDRFVLSSHQTVVAIESVQLKLRSGTARLLD